MSWSEKSNRLMGERVGENHHSSVSKRLQAFDFKDNSSLAEFSALSFRKRLLYPVELWGQPIRFELVQSGTFHGFSPCFPFFTRISGGKLGESPSSPFLFSERQSVQSIPHSSAFCGSKMSPKGDEMDDLIIVTIRNFEKYKGRTDVRLHSWFRMSNRFFEDPDFFDFTWEEKCLWLYLLSLASQFGAGTFTVRARHAQKVCSFSNKAIVSAFDKLVNLQCISVERNVGGTRAVRGRTATEQNRTNRTEQTEQNTANRNDPAAVDPVFSDEFLLPYLSKVSIEAQLAWFATYNDRDWVIHSIREAVTWIKANPEKAPKSLFAKFFASWLSRGWEWRRKNNHSKQNYDEAAFLAKDDL